MRSNSTNLQFVFPIYDKELLYAVFYLFIQNKKKRETRKDYMQNVIFFGIVFIKSTDARRKIVPPDNV